MIAENLRHCMRPVEDQIEESIQTSNFLLIIPISDLVGLNSDILGYCRNLVCDLLTLS